MDWLGNNPDQTVIDALNAACGNPLNLIYNAYNGDCDIFNGRGNIKGSDGNTGRALCYQQCKGSKDTKAAKISKCGKTEAPSLQPSTAPSFAPSDE